MDDHGDENVIVLSVARTDAFDLAAEQVDDFVRNSPRWRQLREALAEILSHYPDAAERVAVMLDQLDL